MEYETFYDVVKDHDGTLRLTVPIKLCEFMGLKPGNKVKVMIAKAEE